MKHFLLLNILILAFLAGCDSASMVSYSSNGDGDFIAETDKDIEADLSLSDDDFESTDGDFIDGDVEEDEGDVADADDFEGDNDGEERSDTDTDFDFETDSDDAIDEDLDVMENDPEPETQCIPDTVCCDSAGNFLPPTTDCSDNDPCTYTDECNGSGVCVGTTYSCNDHGTCNGDDADCTCDVGYAGTFCHQCDPNALGEYPYCFLPNSAFCITSQCFDIPPTNQDSCYDNEVLLTCPGEAGTETCGGVDFCGQDAQYPDKMRTYTCYEADGEVGDCSMMIPVAEDEVVTDSLTGLMWQRMYASSRNWDDAVDYCDELEYGGYTDWRLPSQLELLSIVDNGTINPSTDALAFRGTPSGRFWTSILQPSTEGGARYVGFTYGQCSYYGKTKGCYVRCVRGGYQGSSEGTFDPFVIIGTVEQTVIHKTTGLEWQKTTASDLSWQQSMAYCENLDYAEHTDWRLPNVKELQSLINNETISPCSDFPEMPSVNFWSSSTNAYDSVKGWVVAFSSSAVYPYAKTNTYNARCVRGEP